MRNLKTAGLYLAALVPVALTAVAVEFVSITLINALPGHGPDWIGLPINVAPAFLTGLALYVPLARWACRRGWRSRSTGAYLLRTLPLYSAAALLAAHVWRHGGEQGYWLFGQMVLWPFLSVLGGIVADVIADLLPPRSSKDPLQAVERSA